MHDKINKIISGAGFLAFAYLVSRFFGLFREMAIAWKFGAARSTDVYNASFLIPDILNYMLAAGAFGLVLVPILTRHHSGIKEDTFNQEGSKVFSSILAPMSIIIILLVIGAEIFTPQLTALLYPDFTAYPEKFALTVKLTRIVIPAQIFFTIGGMINATLRARGDFRGSLGGAIYNLGIISTGLFLAAWWGIAGFSLGALAGAFLGPFLLPFVLSRGTIKYSFNLNFRSPHFVNFIKLNIPLMLGITLLTVDEWYSRYFGAQSDISEGTITCLRYARILMLVPIALVGQTAGQASLTYLSQLLQQKDLKDFSRVLTKTIRGVLFITFILAGGLALISLPAVTLIFKRGAFSGANAIYTANLLQYLSLGIPAFAAQQILINGYYARSNTLRVMMVNSLVALLSIFIYYGLKKMLGGEGLALATAASFWLMFMVTLIDYRLRYGRQSSFWTAPIIKTIFKGAAASLVAFIFTYMFIIQFKLLPLDPLTHWGALLQLFVTGGVYVLLALLLTMLLGGVEYQALKSIIFRLSGRRG